MGKRTEPRENARARGLSSTPRRFAARSRVLARLASLAQIAELARRPSLGFPGNPGIREEPGSARNHSSQKLRGFFAHKEKPGKRGKFCHGFPGFSRNSWKTRRARTLLAFPGFFLAFPHLQKKLGKPRILPQNSGLLFAGA